MELQHAINEMLWPTVDGLAAVGIIAVLYEMFFNGGFQPIISLLGNGLWI